MMDATLESLKNRCIRTDTCIGFVGSANPTVTWNDGKTCRTEVVLCGSGTKDRAALMAKNMEEFLVSANEV